MKFHSLMATACAVAAFGQAMAQTSRLDTQGVPPSWDKILPTEPASGVCPNWSPRFTCVMNNSAVRDNETGLVWAQPSLQRMTWWEADAFCLDQTLGNRRGWRLPSAAEASTLIDMINPGLIKLPTKAPFVFAAVTTYSTWTSTKFVPYKTEHQLPIVPVKYYVVNFAQTIVGAPPPGVGVADILQGHTTLAWCVRGPA